MHIKRRDDKNGTSKFQSALLCPPSANLSGEPPEVSQRVQDSSHVTGSVAVEHLLRDLCPPPQHEQISLRGRSTSRSCRPPFCKDDIPASGARKSTFIPCHVYAPRNGLSSAKPQTRPLRANPHNSNSAPKPVSVQRGGRPKSFREKVSQIAEPLQSQWGLNTRDTHVCARVFLREDIGLTCIFQIDLLNEAHLTELSKGLSFIGSRIIQLAWEDLKVGRFSFFPGAGQSFFNPIRSSLV